ncbi:hypothetical protein FB440_104115 [Vibrio crassostreae]|uniref:hypothetical protein n=1 Tax=Vibrio crassostreae TaxID=246167 RepID=UPI00119BC03B|nr:hypothetical protein [Vibrio crassostreae]TWD40952.1 hypothetical protein FB440_104115 [Vibrio crassostreae]
MKTTKNMITATLSTAILAFGLSSAATAAVSNGNLSFVFNGNIPALPVGGTGWGFYDASGNVYTAPASIALTATDTSTGLQLVSTSEDFYVKPNAAGTFATGSKIKALLVSQPTISGTAVMPSQLNTVVTTITLNGQALPVGSTEIDVASIATASGAAQRMSLGAQIDVPTAARSQGGGQVRVTAAIRMSADLT